MDIYLFLLLCTASIAIIGGIGAILWQTLLSRDKELNQKAHLRALKKEAKDLKKLRKQQENYSGFQAHYDILGENKEAIQRIDNKIDTLFEKKLQLIKSYEEMVQQESSSIIKSLNPFSDKKKPSVLCKNFQEKFQLYEAELASLQAHRATLWGVRTDFQKHLLEEENSRNKRLDDLYHRHTVLLEKVYLGHIKSTEEIDKASIEAGTKSFKYSVFYPFQFLTSFFGAQKKSDILKNTTGETRSREMVRQTEGNINEGLAFSFDEDTLSVSSH
ncbi:MAG: hypothetical protein K0U37_02320 [Gammaproteobacteria bacterium]|nr:hypothetical protein [Gammaproteobacteria bacterium]